jgi:hypothetical protein
MTLCELVPERLSGGFVLLPVRAAGSCLEVPLKIVDTTVYWPFIGQDMTKLSTGQVSNRGQDIDFNINVP